MIRSKLELNWVKFYRDGERNTGFPAITAPRLQTMKQTLTTSKYSIEFTYSDFPGHFNRTAISQRWLFVDGSVRGKRLTITANFQERNLGAALKKREKNPARGPYRKKLDRSRARD